MLIFTQPKGQSKGQKTFFVVKICFNLCIIKNRSQMYNSEKNTNHLTVRGGGGGGATLTVSLTLKRPLFFWRLPLEFYEKNKFWLSHFYCSENFTTMVMYISNPSFCQKANPDWAILIVLKKCHLPPFTDLVSVSTATLHSLCADRWFNLKITLPGRGN